MYKCIEFSLHLPLASRRNLKERTCSEEKLSFPLGHGWNGKVRLEGEYRSPEQAGKMEGISGGGMGMID